jgi:hypothetical protein
MSAINSAPTMIIGNAMAVEITPPIIPRIIIAFRPAGVIMTVDVTPPLM